MKRFAPLSSQLTGITSFLPRGIAGLVFVAGLSACSGNGMATSNATITSSKPSQTVSSSTAPVAGIEKLTEQAIQKVIPTVVKVTNVDIGLGSGVIMSASGYIVTNHHVVANAHQIQVTLPNGTQENATLVGSDPVDDLAVIKIKGHNLPHATFGNSSKLVVGQSVLAIGNPLGITQTVTNGIVSALNRTVSEQQNTNQAIPNAVQTSASINPGNSGGALINLGGQVIGIPTLAAVDPEFNAPAAGIGFAIPSNEVISLTGQIIKYGRVIHSGRAALGIEADSVSANMAALYNLPVDHGVLIAGLSGNGGARGAGLRKGDIIVKVGSQPIQSLGDLVNALATKRPGQTVSVTVVTPSGSHQTKQVKLGELAITSNG
ncbi:MAG: trypsin-like peptidase domain-containing protein [Chloroflexota bacterium]|nr:trypsin-like peptidase domain-containing protein [Chloroflexota bacterium]